jgi:hypothetical protein
LISNSPWTGVAVDSVDAIKKIHAGGARKSVSLPPQSGNGAQTRATACTGAENNWRDETAPANNSTQLGPRHAASISNGRAPATQDDPTVQALKAIFKAGPQRGF